MMLSNLLRYISRRHIPLYSWPLPSLPVKIARNKQNTERIVFSTGLNAPGQS